MCNIWRKERPLFRPFSVRNAEASGQQNINGNRKSDSPRMIRIRWMNPQAMRHWTHRQPAGASVFSAPN